MRGSRGCSIPPRASACWRRSTSKSPSGRMRESRDSPAVKIALGLFGLVWMLTHLDGPVFDMVDDDDRCSHVARRLRRAQVGA